MAKCIHAQSGHLPLASIDAFSSLKQFEQYPPLSLIVALLALCMMKKRVSNHFEGLLMLQSMVFCMKSNTGFQWKRRISRFLLAFPSLQHFAH